jgi:macrolide-specific efflux system membrane fusion protein
LPDTTTMDATGLNLVAQPATTAPRSRLGALLHRRILWVAGALVLIGAGAFGYYWAFGKARIVYATATVLRGDLESTVVAAGIVQPVKYVDVGAQTSGKLKSLKVKRGDHVEESQVLAEIDPALADTALTAANATLENMTSQRTVRRAPLVLADVQQSRNDKLFAEQWARTTISRSSVKRGAGPARSGKFYRPRSSSTTWSSTTSCSTSRIRSVS